MLDTTVRRFLGNARIYYVVERIAAVVVTFNPELSRFSELVKSLERQVLGLVIVDNCSENIEEFESNLPPNASLIKLKSNFGIGKALNEGVQMALNKWRPTWILTADQDSIFANDYVVTLFRKIESLSMKDKIGLIGCESTNHMMFHKNKIKRTNFLITSGSLVRSELYSSIRYREEFFLDSIDFDFCSRIRDAGFIIAKLELNLMDHELGITDRKKTHSIRHHELWRVYLISRNSTILFIEGRIGVVAYVYQLIYHLFLTSMFEGLKSTLISLGLGVKDGLEQRIRPWPSSPLVKFSESKSLDESVISSDGE